MKLREMFNKASEGKSKLSVNDFSAYPFVLVEIAKRDADLVGRGIEQSSRLPLWRSLMCPRPTPLGWETPSGSESRCFAYDQG